MLKCSLCPVFQRVTQVSMAMGVRTNACAKMEELAIMSMDNALVLLVFMEIPVSKVCKSSELWRVQCSDLDL